MVGEFHFKLKTNPSIARQDIYQVDDTLIEENEDEHDDDDDNDSPDTTGRYRGFSFTNYHHLGNSNQEGE